MTIFKQVGILLFTLIFGSSVVFASGSYETISWAKLTISLLGGLTLFLFGMEMMSDGMKKTAGNKMRTILAALTRNRVIALICGAFVTMVIQSSSATTVMLVSFVQAGLMSFTQSMGVILGADIGTTITAQMIAFKLTDYALLMVAIGFLIRMFSKDQNIKNIGDAILGFGILFFGMKLMSDAMKPLRTHAEFISMLKGLENPILGVLLAAAFTALIQSSSAFTGIIIVLAQQNLITLEAGIPMVLGANVGTCVTAGLASIGTSREAKRVAMAHVTFKLMGVLLFIFWIPTFADLIRSMAVRFDSGTARQIANAHTIFNVGLGLVFLPFTTIFASLIMKILPEKAVVTDLKPSAWHLDESILSTPAMAIDLARTEVARMAKLLRRMLKAVIVPFFTNEPREDEYFPQLSLVDGINMREDKLNFLEKKITQYLIKISQQNPTPNQVQEIYAMMSIVSDIENIGDLISRNLLPLMAKKKTLKMDFSEEGHEEITIYHQKACKQLSLLEESFVERNLELANKIMSKERKYLDLEQQYKARHLQRLFSEKSNTVETHEIHMELMDIMKQIIVYSCNIANTFHDLEIIDTSQ
jgi:phosphate:Na+ symporter